MEKSTRRKKKSILKSRFYRVYFTVVAVALVCIVGWLIWLNGVVRDYEVAQPIHAAEEVAALFEEGDYDRLYALDTSAPEIADDAAQYVDTLEEVTGDGEITWREAFSTDPNEHKYVVLLDGEKLATFTLVPSGTTTGHGNALWQLGSVTTNITTRQDAAQPVAKPAPELAEAPYRVSAPGGYAVSVDGRALTEADALGAGTSVLPEDFLPSGLAAPAMIEYAFYSDSESPAVTATDAAGNAVTVRSDGENRWTVPLAENEALKAQFSDAIIKLAERVAKYTVKDLSRSAILGNVASDSPAETIIKKFSNEWAPPHKTATVTDAKVSDFYVWSDDCFTCHVEFTFTLRTRRGNDYVYPTSYTFCVVKKKGKGKLYNIQFN